MEYLRVSLDEKDFRELVAGKIVEKTKGEFVIQIALNDIGFARIGGNVLEAMRKMVEGE